MRLTVLTLILVVTAGIDPGFASPQYTITLSNAGEFYSTVPFREDAVTSIPISNGTGTYAAGRRGASTTSRMLPATNDRISCCSTTSFLIPSRCGSRADGGRQGA